MEKQMPQFQAYAKQLSYPHMGSEDAQIWTRFIEKYPDYFNSCAYDVAVGNGASFDTTVNAATGGNVSRLYQRRIDVVAVTDNAMYIIEVKPRASTSSLGQVKNYAKLFVRDYEPQLIVVPLIVTDQLLPDMEVLAKDEKINLIVV